MESNICSSFFPCFDCALADVLPRCCKQIFHFQQWIALWKHRGIQSSLAMMTWHTFHLCFKTLCRNFSFSQNDTRVLVSNVAQTFAKFSYEWELNEKCGWNQFMPPYSQISTGISFHTCTTSHLFEEPFLLPQFRWNRMLSLKRVVQFLLFNCGRQCFIRIWHATHLPLGLSFVQQILQRKVIKSYIFSYS